MEAKAVPAWVAAVSVSALTTAVAVAYIVAPIVSNCSEGAVLPWAYLTSLIFSLMVGAVLWHGRSLSTGESIHTGIAAYGIPLSISSSRPGPILKPIPT
jgi:hypothetical protein